MKKEKNALSKSRERDFTSQITTLPGPKEFLKRELEEKPMREKKCIKTNLKGV